MDRVIYADSHSSADLFYATRFLAPDPFLYFTARGKSYAVLSDLEVDRARREATVDRVLHYSAFRGELEKKLKRRPSTDEVCVHILKKHGVRRASVPGNFPFRTAILWIRAGVKLSVPKGPFFPGRLRKSPREVAEIGRALRITERLLGRAREILAAARATRNGRLKWGGSVLTSERVQSEIQVAALKMGALAEAPIIAGGAQACDPHERGHGPLKAGELIIVDIFPQLLKSRYWGDMTRTFIKGRAKPAQRALFATVSAAQERAFELIRPGVRCEKVHAEVTAFFERRGYRTGEFGGRQQGFIHGTGHGLGLEIHEGPGMGRVSDGIFAPGNVVTVEPGLYYSRQGGVRIEDVVLVTRGKVEKLSRFPYALEI